MLNELRSYRISLYKAGVKQMPGPKLKARGTTLIQGVCTRRIA